jgi:hypothetical protein
LKFGVLKDRRWAAFASDALRRLRRSWAALVCGLLRLKLDKREAKDNRAALLLALADYTFVAALYWMSDVVEACASMSLSFQPTASLAATQGSTVDQCIRQLRTIEQNKGCQWTAFQASLEKPTEEGGRAYFHGVPLVNYDSHSEFDQQRSSFVGGCIASVVARFEDTDPIAKATTFLDFFMWPWQDAQALALHYNAEVSLIAQHFSPALKHTLPNLINQFVAIKCRMKSMSENGMLKGILQEHAAGKLTPSLKLERIQNVWKLVREWDSTEFGQAHIIIDISQCGMDASAVVERGWREANGRKALDRLALNAGTLHEELMLKFNGPDLRDWNPGPSAESWFTRGKRRRQILHKRKRRNDRGLPRKRRVHEPSAADLTLAVRRYLGDWVPENVVVAEDLFATKSLAVDVGGVTTSDEDSMSTSASEESDHSEFCPSEDSQDEVSESSGENSDEKEESNKRVVRPSRKAETGNRKPTSKRKTSAKRRKKVVKGKGGDPRIGVVIKLLLEAIPHLPKLVCTRYTKDLVKAGFDCRTAFVQAKRVEDLQAGGLPIGHALQLWKFFGDESSSSSSSSSSSASGTGSETS